MTKIFFISRGYRKAVIWTGNRDTRQRISQSTIRPNRGLTRLERYKAIERGFAELDINMPAFKATEKA